MKHVYVLCTFLVVLFSSVNAQIHSGQWHAGGQINLYGNTNNILDTAYVYDAVSQTSMIVPSIGYFVSPTVSVGLNVKYGVAHTVQTHNYELVPTSRTDTYTYHTKVMELEYLGETI